MDQLRIFLGDVLGIFKNDNTGVLVNVIDEGKDVIQILLVVNFV